MSVPFEKAHLNDHGAKGREHAAFQKAKMQGAGRGAGQAAKPTFAKADLSTRGKRQEHPSGG